MLVEDLMTDGGSKLNFLDAVNRTGAKTKAIFVIFNYGIIKEHFSFFRKEKYRCYIPYKLEIYIRSCIQKKKDPKY